MKQTLLKEEKADLLLNCSTNFTAVIDNVKELGLFENIILSPDSIEDNRKFNLMSKEEKIVWSRNPVKYTYDTYFPNRYTDYYVAELTIYTLLIYYSFIAQGMNLKIHFYEEGMIQYVLDPKRKINASGIDHSYYGDKAFYNALQEMILYEPDLYTASEIFCPIQKLPKIDYKDAEVRRIYNQVFGCEELPKEKYVFLEEPFIWDRIDATDIDVLDQVAEIVGKENIIVKLHPRNNIDRFTERGYKTMENSSIPWEIVMMNSDLTKKVLLTISSNASISSIVTFGKRMYSIQLKNIMSVGMNMATKEPTFTKYFGLLQQRANSEKKQIFVPDSIIELEEDLKFINGKIKYESREE